MIAIQKSVAETILDAVTVTGAGSTYALPASSVQVTWQALYSSAPAAVSLVLQASNNNSDWITIDTTTNTAGEVRTVNISANFIRANLVSKTGAVTFSVIVVAKEYANYANLSLLVPIAYASLPTPSTGMLAVINDANTTTWGATIAGGSSSTVLAVYNGTNWTVVGK
jgi:hypothetical protein